MAMYLHFYCRYIVSQCVRVRVSVFSSYYHGTASEFQWIFSGHFEITGCKNVAKIKQIKVFATFLIDFFNIHQYTQC